MSKTFRRGDKNAIVNDGCSGKPSLTKNKKLGGMKIINSPFIDEHDYDEDDVSNKLANLVDLNKFRDL